MRRLLFLVICLVHWENFLEAQAVFYARTQVQYALDAEAYWFGPQAGVGVGVQWASGWGILSEYYGFWSKVGIEDANGVEKGTFQQQTLTLMGSRFLGRSKGRGLYLMGGIAFQSRLSDFNGSGWGINEDRDFVTAAFEFGHKWPISKHGYGMSASLKFTGPVVYDKTPNVEIITDPVTNIQTMNYYGNSYTMEVLTQLSAGIVIDRVFLKNRKQGK